MDGVVWRVIASYCNKHWALPLDVLELDSFDALLNLELSLPPLDMPLRWKWGVHSRRSTTSAHVRGPVSAAVDLKGREELKDLKGREEARALLAPQ